MRYLRFIIRNPRDNHVVYLVRKKDGSSQAYTSDGTAINMWFINEHSMLVYFFLEDHDDPEVIMKWIKARLGPNYRIELYESVAEKTV